jgi:hypothetical protein
MLQAALAAALLSATCAALLARSTAWERWHAPHRPAPLTTTAWQWGLMGLVTGPIGLALLLLERRHVQPHGVHWSHPEAGWHRDPFGQHRRRFWDGEDWTSYTRGALVQLPHPLVSLLVIVACVAVWSTGDLDRSLSSVGLNRFACEHRDGGGGTTFCGDQLDALRAHEAAAQARAVAAPGGPASASSSVTGVVASSAEGVACVSLARPSDGDAGVRCGTREPGAGRELFARGGSRPATQWSWPAADGAMTDGRAGAALAITTRGMAPARAYDGAPVHCVVVAGKGMRCRNADNRGFFIGPSAQRHF